jgi:cell growth-regulating nucleolar protein
MSLITTKKSKKTSDGDRVRKHKRRLRENGDDRPAQKMIEYKPMNGDTENSGQMVVYRENARAELFMSFVNKGPESEKGCSMNKTLKRFHRERENMGFVHRKGQEEKELWRSLRLKKNDRGEIVLFCARA